MVSIGSGEQVLEADKTLLETMKLDEVLCVGMQGRELDVKWDV